MCFIRLHHSQRPQQNLTYDINDTPWSGRRSGGGGGVGGRWRGVELEAEGKEEVYGIRVAGFNDTSILIGF